jgi:hypothetical protein
MISSGVASISWMLVDLLLTGRPSIVGIMNGSPFHFFPPHTPQVPWLA